MGKLSSFGRAVMLSLVIWTIGAVVLLLNFVHVTPKDKGRISSTVTIVDSASPPSMRATPLVEIPKPANYCDSHGPHTQIWGSPQFRVQQSKLPLIAIAVATTSRHMEDRNGPDADKVSTSELQRRGQQSFSDGIFKKKSLLLETDIRAIPPSKRAKILKIRNELNISGNASSNISFAALARARRQPLELDSFSIFRVLLPSVTRTVECGFRYAVVIGFDMGDPFYDSPLHRRSIRAWFHENVIQPTRTRGIDVDLAFARVNNTLRKPGPAFTAMTRAAFDDARPTSGDAIVDRMHKDEHPADHTDASILLTPRHSGSTLHRSNGGLGATFCYRINDDSEFLTPWASNLTEALVSLGPPFGVVGPLVCNRGGNARILTHDFTHREHMAIFDRWYYPPELADWWMDTWISRVYVRYCFKRKITI